MQLRLSKSSKHLVSQRDPKRDSEPENTIESQKLPEKEPLRARESQREPERARESQGEPKSDPERAMEGEALVKSKNLWQISLAHSAAHPAWLTGLLTSSLSLAP